MRLRTNVLTFEEFVAALPSPAEDVTHLVFDNTPDQALCGADVTGQPFVSAFGPAPPECKECASRADLFESAIEP